jgi:hypothetical protein
MRPTASGCDVSSASEIEASSAMLPSESIYGQPIASAVAWKPATGLGRGDHKLNGTARFYYTVGASRVSGERGLSVANAGHSQDRMGTGSFTRVVRCAA